MAHLVTVELVLDVVDPSAAADEINEVLGARRCDNLPDATLLDYRIETIEQLELDPQRYGQGDAFRLREAAQAAGEADPSESAMNQRRAQWAQHGLAKFAQAAGLDLETDFETAVGDLLANLRHLCDARDLDYAALDRRAYSYYLAELADARAETGVEMT